MTGLTLYVVWALCSIFSIWQIIVLMSYSGRVQNDDRLMLLFAITPFSLMMAPILLLVQLVFWAGKRIDRFKESPRYVTWKIKRKIRKRRRGPVVRVVEYLYNKREEKRREKEISEV